MAKEYNKMPSEILCIKDEYDAYCFNEACFYIKNKIDSGQKPMFKKNYKSFSDIYKRFNK